MNFFISYPKTKFCLLLLSTATIISCGKETKEEKAAQPELRPLFENITSTPQQATPASQGNGNAIVNNQEASTPVPALNPPHGQPHHRCEIAVGAPLNSASSTATAPANTQAQNPQPAQMPFVPPAVQQSVNNAPPTQTAPGMNPPHGQPNHRCDIAVGAPLPS